MWLAGQLQCLPALSAFLPSKGEFERLMVYSFCKWTL